MNPGRLHLRLVGASATIGSYCAIGILLLVAVFLPPLLIPLLFGIVVTHLGRAPRGVWTPGPARTQCGACHVGFERGPPLV